jgi:uncharacterized protein (TIGR03435 family)
VIAAFGQSTPTFEVVSVRPTPPGERSRTEGTCEPNGRFFAHGTPLLWTVKWSYNLADFQLADGWPAWANAFDTYDIEARAAGPVPEDQCKLMVQAFFADRFKLRTHREKRNTSAYELVKGRKGPKLQTGGAVTINGQRKQTISELAPPDGWTMPRFANYLASVKAVDRPVLDSTGLKGTFGFTLNYATSDTDNRPDVFAALQDQLGLKLQSLKAPVEIMIIDHIEKPGEN